jgi:phosphatidylserine/phosphatidylglycerophosphate/cardiolipin synthase-like enzyme
MWAFTRPGLAEKLAAKRRAGCWVDIVYNPDSMAASVKSALTFTGGPQLTPCKFNVGPGLDIRPHNKTMLLDGDYNGSITPRVYTGSHNYAVSALRQADEALLRITSASYHVAFLSNFYKIRDTCRSRTTG